MRVGPLLRFVGRVKQSGTHYLAEVCHAIGIRVPELMDRRELAFLLEITRFSFLLPEAQQELILLARECYNSTIRDRIEQRCKVYRADE